MKKIIIVAVAFLVLAAAGGGWYIMTHRTDPMQEAKNLLQKGDIRAAGLQLRNALRDQPSDAEAHALLSQVQLMQGDAVAAEKEIKQAAQLNWNRAAVNGVLAQTYIAQSKWNQILAELPQAGDSPAQTAFFLMARALAHRGLNDMPAAKASIAQAEQVAPANAEVRVTAARLALSEGNRGHAMEEVDKAISLDPNKTDALELKAQLVAQSGDREAAIALMNKAVEKAPANLMYRLERAGLLLAQGDDKRTGEDVDAVLAKDPKNYGALYLRMVLLAREQKFADADVLLQQLDPVLPRFQRGLYFKAMVKSNVAQLAQAEDAITSYVARYPADPDGVRLLARIELTTGRPARAIPVLLSAVSRGQSDYETLDLLGRAYAMSGQRAEAEKAFKEASSAAGNNPTQLTRVASSLLQVGDLSGAAADLDRTLKTAPAQPGAGEALVATALRMGDLDRAQQALDQLRAQTGDTEAVGILSGLLKLARLDPNGALQDFTATAQKFPNSIPAKLNEAKLLLQLGRRSEATPLLQQILEKNPAMAEPLSLLVQALLIDNHGADAIAAVERAHAAEPTNLGIITGQAELYARLGDLPRALQVLDAAKVEGKTPLQLLPILGRVQLALGQNDAAKSTFAAIVAAEPNNVAAVRSQMELLARLKDADGARQVGRDALRRMPGNLAIMEALVSVELADKGLDSALALADRLRAEPANMPAAALLKGDLLMNARRFSDAAAAYGDEYRREPSSVLVLRLANALHNAGSQAKAISELQNWAAAHPNDADVAQVLASTDISAKRYDEAEKHLQVVLNQRPNDPAALNNLAWIYQNKGDARARQTAQRAYMAAPTPDIADTLAWILVSQGDATKALPLLQNASAARPDNASIKYHLAVALKDLNRRDEAISILKPLVEPSVNFEEKPAAQQLLADLSKAKP